MLWREGEGTLWKEGEWGGDVEGGGDVVKEGML